MERLGLYATIMIGPCFGTMFVSLIIARRLFRDTQILFDISEWILLILATIVSFAIAGVVVQLL